MAGPPQPARTVILYGDANNWFAAWAFWQFKIYGHEDVRLMNGGGGSDNMRGNGGNDILSGDADGDVVAQLASLFEGGSYRL